MCKKNTPNGKTHATLNSFYHGADPFLSAVDAIPAPSPSCPASDSGACPPAQEGYLGHVADAVRTAERVSSGHVLVLNTGGTVPATRRQTPIHGVSPAASVRAGSAGDYIRDKLVHWGCLNNPQCTRVQINLMPLQIFAFNVICTLQIFDLNEKIKLLKSEWLMLVSFTSSSFVRFILSFRDVATEK